MDREREFTGFTLILPDNAYAPPSFSPGLQPVSTVYGVAALLNRQNP